MSFQKLAPDISRRAAHARFSSLLGGVDALQVFGPVDAEIGGITTDSRLVHDRSLFVAVEGEHTDGHRYVQEAIERGAAAVVVQERQYRQGLQAILSPAYVQHNMTTVAVVEDTRTAVAVLADRFYGSPASKLRFIGITGTNGKTTTAYLMRSVLERGGWKTGLIGTIAVCIGRKERPATFTTPPAEELHRLCAEMVAAGCTWVVMEVSSHALALKRVHGLRFDAAMFTNLTQDHLDFHGTMEAYRDAKLDLFRLHLGGPGVFNRDDPSWSFMAAPVKGKRVTYGQDARSTFRIRGVRATRGGTTVVLRYRGMEHEIRTRLIGSFNAYNLAAAFAAGVTIGMDPERVVEGLRRVRHVPGRFERLASRDGVLAVVDYSHTPDALEKAILSARAFTAKGGRVLTVFGCGGDRDQAKRPLMGAVSTRLSDYTVMTSDNPRNEDPERILDDIARGIPCGAPVERIADRRKAIERALRFARPGDVVLVAGKGHETWQIRDGKRRHFDDREVIRRYFERKRGGTAA
ncbi:MAG: UDP-N-acetylmuramoyl-L-alanyl-D-glutamate--2,6-diaminopimelate ligase [Bacteroidota bacterium]|nr:UDP-N-acetylmuramoyl-L-alanyl-D-glutamate--2,6-diaminopimelate ligase [Bacteroidota bacterium]